MFCCDAPRSVGECICRQRTASYTDAVDSHDDFSKLDALVGAALKRLVEAGASSEAVGAFAASYRTEVAQILGLAESRPAEPDLGELVQAAVSRALSEAGVIGQGRARRRARKFFVKVDGRRTSVLVAAEQADELVQKLGRRQANEVVARIAQSAPSNIDNRSGWVQDQLRAGVHLVMAHPAGGVTH